MNGRVYDPFLGRFLSPDPIIQNPGNSQNYNRYSYCLNNPLKYTDPSGYKAKPVGWDGSWEWGRDLLGSFRGHGGSGIHGSNGQGGGGSFNNSFGSDKYNMLYNALVNGSGLNFINQIVQAFSSYLDAGYTLYPNMVLNDATYNVVAIGEYGLVNNADGSISFSNATATAFSGYLGDGYVNENAAIGGGLVTAVDMTNNGIGGFGTGMGWLDGTFRLSKGGNLSPKHYVSNWTGGSRAKITTYNAAKWGSRVSKGSIVVSVGLGFYNINKANIKDGRTFGYNTQLATAQTIGGIGGAMAGAEIGAAIGVWFGGFGAIPGAVIGGVVGGVLVGWGGSELGGAAVEWYY